MITARTAQEVKAQVKKDSIFHVVVEPKARGAIVGVLNAYLGGDENRYTVLAWLFDNPSPLSTKNLTDGQWYSIHAWISSRQDESTGKWVTGDCFPAEAALVLTEALRWMANSKKSEVSNFDNPNKVLMAGVSIPGAVITNVSGVEDGKAVWLRDPEKAEMPMPEPPEFKQTDRKETNDQKEEPPQAGNRPPWSKPPTKKSALKPIKF